MLNDYSVEVNEMLSLLRDVAKTEILPRYGKVKGVGKVEKKGFKEIVTEADLKASERILSIMRKKFPGSYSEEHKFEDRFDHDLIWQIDPLDGTDEFCNQIIEGVACHAALLKRLDGKYTPVAGIIYLPGVDKAWFTDGTGKVTFVKEGKITQIPSYKKDEVIGIVRKIDPNDKLIHFYQKLGNVLGLKSSFLYGGGAGSYFSDLFEGKVNIVIFNYDYSKEWDTAMAEPIIRALGGFICDLEGNEFTYNRQIPENYDQPYNLKGWVASIAFKKQEIVPHITKDLLIEKL